MTTKRALLTPLPPTLATALVSGETVVPRITGEHDATAAITPGTLVLSYFTATKTETISSVECATSSTAAGATPTLAKIGVYSVASNGNLTLVASTASDTSLFDTANTVYPRTFASPFTKTAGQRYAVGYLVVSGAAAPTILGASAASTATANWANAPRLAGTVASQTDLPSSVTAGTVAASSRMPQFALLP